MGLQSSGIRCRVLDQWQKEFVSSAYFSFYGESSVTYVLYFIPIIVYKCCIFWCLSDGQFVSRQWSFSYSGADPRSYS